MVFIAVLKVESKIDANIYKPISKWKLPGKAKMSFKK